jgi:hypothetical protein
MEIKSSLPILYRGGSPAESPYSGDSTANGSRNTKKHDHTVESLTERPARDVVEISHWSAKQFPSGGRYAQGLNSVDRESVQVSGSHEYGPVQYNSLGRIHTSRQSDDSVKGLIIDIWV